MSGNDKGKKRQLSLTQMFAKKQKGTASSVIEMSESEDPHVGFNIALPSSSRSTEIQKENLDNSDTRKEAQEEPQPSEFHRLDIGNYIGKENIPDSVKFELLTNCWKPSETYKFPAVTELGKKR
jgi:hypothetical protein